MGLKPLQRGQGFRLQVQVALATCKKTPSDTNTEIFKTSPKGDCFSLFLSVEGTKSDESMASSPQDETDLLKSESFWRIAATAVFLQHLLLLRPEGPFEDFEDLSFWLVQLLKSSGAEIAGQLETHEVLLSASPADDLAALLNLDV